jgi:hypothetical protein
LPARGPSRLDFEYIEAPPSIEINEIEVYDEHRRSIATWFSMSALDLRSYRVSLAGSGAVRVTAVEILDEYADGDRA